MPKRGSDADRQFSIAARAASRRSGSKGTALAQFEDGRKMDPQIPNFRGPAAAAE
jgi:hypothetical protein